MDRAQKAEAVAELNRTFSEVGVVVVTRNLGMTVAQALRYAAGVQQPEAASAAQAPAKRHAACWGAASPSSSCMKSLPWHCPKIARRCA